MYITYPHLYIDSLTHQYFNIALVDKKCFVTVFLCTWRFKYHPDIRIWIMLIHCVKTDETMTQTGLWGDIYPGKNEAKCEEVIWYFEMWFAFKNVNFGMQNLVDFPSPPLCTVLKVMALKHLALIVVLVAVLSYGLFFQFSNKHFCQFYVHRRQHLTDVCKESAGKCASLLPFEIVRYISSLSSRWDHQPLSVAIQNMQTCLAVSVYDIDKTP